MTLSPKYDSSEHEQPVYAQWMAADAFTPAAESEGRETFTIVMPPPNVTGVLHMGHALNGTLQDIVIRYQRMRGKDALWVPGTDHAGIATQAVVERKLLEEEGKTRKELGRDAFVERVWEWKEEHGNKIFAQLQRLGASCDWSRARFTFEEHFSRAVRDAFVRLWDKGLVYRGARIVNWDCVLGTAVSDDEVEMKPLKAKLHYFRYPVEVEGGGEPERFITVATTRPETMLGDTGVAVHPDDERYGDLVGKKCVVPFVNRAIPIVADESVNPEFGTGAVKVTPGHDLADYERGARHRLPIINILNKDGTLNDNAAEFAGLSREEARKRVIAAMDDLGLLEKVEKYEHNVPISDRSKTPIEPLVSEQWFVKMSEFSAPAIDAVRSGKLTLKPERYAKTYISWLEGVHDWCISRQLWWGHRIPVWYDEDGEPIASRDDIEIGSAHPVTGKKIVRQDEDVLDTWASSWLWPFATLGWPDASSDLKRFYPTQFLSTARDIIYLWVTRMVMAGYEFADHLPESERCPFATCYIHATVLDAKGRRMSKSLGNGIDPIEMIDTYGADAMRLSLVLLTRGGQDVKLSTDRFEMGRRFTNKIWNATRFVLQNMDGGRDPVGTGGAAPAALEDRWILSRLGRVRASVTSNLESYDFNDAATTLYKFVWNDLCDWYLELCKSRLTGEDEAGARAARGTLVHVLDTTLRMLHPFTPFQTEVLWRALHDATGTPDAGLLITTDWPAEDAALIDDAAEQEIQVLQELVHAVRSIRALTTIGERKPLEAIVVAPGERERGVLNQCAARARAMAHLASLEVHEACERPASSAVGVATGFEVFVPLGADVEMGALVETLERRVDKLTKGLAGVRGKLENQGFLRNADPDVVEAERERMGEMEIERTLLERNLAGLK